MKVAWMAVVFIGEMAAMASSAASEAKGVTLQQSIPEPLDNPGEWITKNDYPAAALKDLRAGSVRFRLNVNAAGVVTECMVIVSSGSADLDLATCDIIAKRALFSPARDAAGNAQPGVYTNRVVWVIPKQPLLQPSRVVTRYIVEADGKMSHCEIVAVSGDAPNLPHFGKFVCSSNPFGDSYLDTNGNPVRRQVTLTQTVTLDVAESSP